MVFFGWEIAAPTYNGKCLFWLGIRSSNIQWDMSLSIGIHSCSKQRNTILFGWECTTTAYWNSSLGWGITATSYSETCFFGWEFTVTSYNGSSSFFSWDRTPATDYGHDSLFGNPQLQRTIKLVT